MIIRNIWCVGRNYAEHAKEFGNPAPAENDTPMIFLKAGSAASVNSVEIVLPKWTELVHHEVELALKFNNRLEVSEAAVALDLTERKVQAAARQSGGPWTLAKSFSESCPISAFFPFKNLNELADLSLRLWVNDELKQEGRTSQMIHSIPALVEYVTQMFPVCAGDVLLTGTPAGVGPIQRGDKLRGQIEGHITHQWQVI